MTNKLEGLEDFTYAVNSHKRCDLLGTKPLVDRKPEPLIDGCIRKKIVNHFSTLRGAGN